MLNLFWPKWRLIMLGLTSLDKKGQYWLIEINSSPNNDTFVRDNDRQIVVTMFKGVLETLIVNKKP